MTIETTYCANHPTRETSLRCHRCEKYICPSCAVHSPTGYICKECKREGLKKFDTFEWHDFITGPLVAAVLSGVASVLIGIVGGLIPFYGWLAVVFAAPFAGGIIAEAVRFAVRRRRGRNLFYAVAAGAVVGALPVMLVTLFTSGPFGLIYQAIYLVLAVPTLFYRLSGIQFTR
jgi:hypothetical protein